MNPPSPSSPLRSAARRNGLSLLLFCLLAGCRPQPVQVTAVPTEEGSSRLLRPRAGHSAFLLADGRVLALGGWETAEWGERPTGRPVLSTEIFDPVHGVWEQPGSWLVAMVKGAVAALDGEAVLVAGGEDEDGSPHAFVVLLQGPCWAASISEQLPDSRSRAEAVTLPGQRVLVVGGFTSHRRLLGAGAIFTLATGTWRRTAPLREPRIYHTATLLADGRVLVAGGTGGRTIDPLRSAEIYDLDHDRWAPAADLPKERQAAEATLLNDGSVLITGGRGADGVPVETALRYGPAGNRWSIAAPMHHPRVNHTSTYVPGHGVIVVGGRDARGVLLRSVERYDPAANRWEELRPLRVGREHHTATLLGPETMLIVGGAVRPSPDVWEATGEVERYSLPSSSCGVGRSNSCAGRPAGT